MSPPLLGLEGEGQSNPSLALTPSSLDSGLKERNYLGLTNSSSVNNSTLVSLSSDDSKRNLNLKATELRLSLPGSQSPVRDSQPSCLLGSLRPPDEKPLFPLTPCKTTGVSGNKRVFSDTDSEEFVDNKNYKEGNWMFKVSSSEIDLAVKTDVGMNGILPSKTCANAGVKSFGVKEQSGSSQQQAIINTTPKSLQESPLISNNNNDNVPAAKAQVVGWPPIGSFRKNTLAISSKNNDEVDRKPGASPLFMKVSMDGAPYLRKVDLRLYSTYQELSCGLEEMFSCFTLGRCGSGAPEREKMSESKLKDLLHGSEYVLTYEDKDGDWMLVGDVPWEMFIDSCKRLKITKSTDAIGLAPRAMEKSKIRN